jgi:GNAT superfamily N-acetyltransferase
VELRAARVDDAEEIARLHVRTWQVAYAHGFPAEGLEGLAAGGGGAGQALMAALLRALRDERFQEAILWVLEDNPRTRRFYELAGWGADGAVRS